LPALREQQYQSGCQVLAERPFRAARARRWARRVSVLGTEKREILNSQWPCTLAYTKARERRRCSNADTWGQELVFEAVVGPVLPDTRTISSWAILPGPGRHRHRHNLSDGRHRHKLSDCRQNLSHECQPQPLIGVLPLLYSCLSFTPASPLLLPLLYSTHLSS
jgi:hypothetical protein